MPGWARTLTTVLAIGLAAPAAAPASEIWSAPARLAEGPSLNLDIGVAPGGDAMAVVRRDGGVLDTIWLPAGGGPSAPERLAAAPEPGWGAPHPAVADDGTAFVTVEAGVAVRSAGRWTVVPVPGWDPGRAHALATDALGNGVLAWEGPDGLQVAAVSAAGLGPPAHVADYAYELALLVAPDGRAAVAWNDYDGTSVATGTAIGGVFGAARRLWTYDVPSGQRLFAAGGPDATTVVGSSGIDSPVLGNPIVYTVGTGGAFGPPRRLRAGMDLIRAAAGPAGSIALGWIRGMDAVVTLGDGPERVPGTARAVSMQLGIDARGTTMLAVAQSDDSDSRIISALVHRAGASAWCPPEVLSRSGTYGGTPRLELDARGGGVLVWQEGPPLARAREAVFARYRTPSACPPPPPGSSSTAPSPPLPPPPADAAPPDPPTAGAAHVEAPFLVAAPSLRLGSVARLDRSRRSARLRVACPGPAACKGRVELRRGGLVARGRFVLAARTAGLARVRLNARGRRLARRHAARRVRATATTAGGTWRRMVVLGS